MPGDSLQVNNKAIKQNTYDAIVVGSGISDIKKQGIRVFANLIFFKHN